MAEAVSKPNAATDNVQKDTSQLSGQERTVDEPPRNRKDSEDLEYTDAPVTTSTGRVASPDDATQSENPLVDQLHGMFPSLDKETIADVLAGERNDADAAVPLLLMLSGQSDAINIDSISKSGYGNSQMDADEALARQLAEEESHQHRQAYSNLSYEPRRSQPTRNQQDFDETGNGRDEFGQVLDTVKAGAERARQFGTGLFNTLSTKFKDMQLAREEQQRQQQEMQARQEAAPASAASATGYDVNKSSRAIPVPNRGQTASPNRIGTSLPYANRYSTRSSPNRVGTPPVAIQRNSFGNSDSESQPRGASPSLGTSPLAKTTLSDWPKQRISLIDNSTGAGTPRKSAIDDSDDEDEDQEFTKNPFEDRD